MKKIILSILFIAFVFTSIGQNLKGYYVEAFTKLEAKRAFVIDLDTFYATTQLSGIDTILATKEYVKSRVSNLSYDSNWNGVDSVAPSKNAVYDKIESMSAVSYCPATMTVNRGTLNTGTVTDLCAVGGTDVNITELSGADPLRVTFQFLAVNRMNYFTFYGDYSGGASHVVWVQIYNPTTTNWDYLGQFGTSSTKQWYSFPIFTPNTYISAGEVQVRLNHQGNGISAHSLILDYVDINYGGAGGGTNIAASTVSFAPSGNVSSTNVQTAIEEVDSEKVAGAASSTDNAIARFDGITGKTIQNSSLIINDNGNASISSYWEFLNSTNTPATNAEVIWSPTGSGGLFVQSGASLSLSSDEDGSGTGVISFKTNGTERGRFLNNGGFLIGTTTDSGDKLNVNGTIKSTTAKLTNLTDNFLSIHQSDAVGLINSNVFQTSNKLRYNTTLTTFDNDNDIPNVWFVNQIAAGNMVKLPVDAATTGNITLSGTQIIDGYAAGVGSRILVWKQTTASQNGVYIVAAGAWTRATDLDTWTKLYKAYVTVQYGGQFGSSFVCTVPLSGTLETDPVPWILYLTPVNIVVSSPLAKLGNNISLGYDTNTLDVASNLLKVKDNVYQPYSTILTNTTATYTDADSIKLAGLITNAVPQTRTLTINGTTQDLSANRTYNVGTVTSIATGLGMTGGTITNSGTVALDTASTVVLSRQRAENTYQSKLTNPITGTGTVNYVSKWTGTNSQGNSQIFDNGTNVGFNTNAPGRSLHIKSTPGTTGVTGLLLDNVNGHKMGLFSTGSSHSLGANKFIIYDETSSTKGDLGLNSLDAASKTPIVFSGLSTRITGGDSYTPFGFYSNVAGQQKTYFIPNGDQSGVADGQAITAIKLFGSDFIADHENYDDFGIYNAPEALVFNSKHLGTGTIKNFSWRYMDVTELMNLDVLTGNLGIGVNDQSQKLDINGNARFRSIGTGTMVSRLGITSDGTLTTNVPLVTETDPIFAADSAEILHWSDTINVTKGIASQYDLTTGLATKQNTLTTGNLTENVTGLQFDATRQVVGGSAQLSLTSGYVIPTTTEQTNWNSAYSNRITSLTTTGNSGVATLVSNILNVPNYTLSGLGGVPTTRTITINGTAQDLSANRSWDVGTVTNVVTGLGLSGGTITTTGTIALDTASTVVLSRQRAVNTYQPKGTYQTGTESYISNLSLSGNTLTSTGIGSAFNSTVGNIANTTSANVFNQNQTVTSTSSANGFRVQDAGSLLISSVGTDYGLFYMRDGNPYFVNGDFGSSEINLTPSPMIYPSAGIAVSTGSAWGTSITDNSANWNTSYNDKVNSLSVTGTTTKTITLTQQDGGTVTGNFTDNDTYTSLVSNGGLGASGGSLYLSNANATGTAPLLTDYMWAAPSSSTTVKSFTLQTLKDLIGTSSYTLPLAANGTRGGIQIGYTSTANNFALQLSSEKAYTSLPDATTSVKGIASFNSGNFSVSSGAVSIATGGIGAMNLANAVISGQVDIGADIVDTDEFLISDAGTLRRTDASRLKTYIGAGFTDPMTTAGDIIFRDGANNTSRLPIGTGDYVLKSYMGTPSWQPIMSGTTSGAIPFNNGSGSINNDGAAFTYNTSTNTLDADVVTVDTEVYDPTGWNGDLSVPTKDAVRDKIETMQTSYDTYYDNNSIVLNAGVNNYINIFTSPASTANTIYAIVDIHVDYGNNTYTHSSGNFSSYFNGVSIVKQNWSESYHDFLTTDVSIIPEIVDNGTSSTFRIKLNSSVGSTYHYVVSVKFLHKL